jgi:hypothetical protein
MMAAIAATVSAPSTLRLVSVPVGLLSGPAEAGLSSKLALAGGFGVLEELGVGADVGTGAAGPTKATGCATTGDGAEAAVTGALLTGALWRPTE